MGVNIPLVQTPDRLVNQLQQNIKQTLEGPINQLLNIGTYLSATGGIGTLSISDPQTVAGPLNLSQGDWDVSFVLACLGGGGSQTSVKAGINFTPNSSADWVSGDNQGAVTVTVATVNSPTITIPSYRVLVTSTSGVKVYLTALAFTQGNTVNGRISARLMAANGS